MCQKAVQTIFQSVAIAKLLYASSAWSEFIKAIDLQRVDGFLRRSVRRMITARLTFPHLLNNVPLLTNSILRKSVATVTTCFTVSFLHLQLLHKTTASDLEFTVYS